MGSPGKCLVSVELEDFSALAVVKHRHHSNIILEVSSCFAWPDQQPLELNIEH